jgi:hypothetical protein
VVVVPLEPKLNEGSLTGVRNTITHATATQHAAAMPSSLRLCSSAPRRALKKKPLSKKNRTTLMELFTRPAYQNEAWVDTRMGPSDPSAVGG